jgi:hypothetical protein
MAQNYTRELSCVPEQYIHLRKEYLALKFSQDTNQKYMGAYGYIVSQ